VRKYKVDKGAPTSDLVGEDFVKGKRRKKQVQQPTTDAVDSFVQTVYLAREPAGLRALSSCLTNI